MENKFNWGTFILGLVVGAVLVAIVFLAGKPAKSGAVGNVINCSPSGLGFSGCLCNIANDPSGGSALGINLTNVPSDVCMKIGGPIIE